MSGVDKKKKAFDTCQKTADCIESYLQCVSIDEKNEVSKMKADGGTGDGMGVCYPLSVAPLASAVEIKLIGTQKNIKKNDGDEFGGWRDILGIVGASVGAIVIIYGMVKMKQYIDKNKTG
jgi:hypothetical protein